MSPPHVWSQSGTKVDPESEDDLEFIREVLGVAYMLRS